MTSIVPNPQLEKRQRREIERLIRTGHVPLKQFQDDLGISIDELAQFGYMRLPNFQIVSATREHLGPNGARFIREVHHGGTHLFRAYFVRLGCENKLATEVRLKRHLRRMLDRGQKPDFEALTNVTILYSRA